MKGKEALLEEEGAGPDRGTSRAMFLGGANGGPMGCSDSDSDWSRPLINSSKDRSSRSFRAIRGDRSLMGCWGCW